MHNTCTAVLLTSLILNVMPSPASAADAAPPAKPLTLDVWTQSVPGKVSDKEESEQPSRGDNVRRVTNVGKPTLTVFQARGSGTPKPAVLVCPGGGYSILAFDKEGTEIAEWLNSIGVTAVLLKYRVPENRDGAFQDVQRAMGLVRHHAAEWKIDPRHVGVMGFSAGGHLSARLSTGYGKRTYARVDAADDLGCRPDFTILIYPAYLSEDGSRLAPEIVVTAQTPPAFLIHTEDDKKHVPSSVAYDKALKQEGVPVELHLFQTGGHGYGLRPSKDPVSQWPQLAAAWLKKSGVTSSP